MLIGVTYVTIHSVSCHRFYFIYTNRSTPLTLQAQCLDDLHEWLLVMDGKEPVSYLILMKSEFSVEIACNYILIFFALGASSKLNSR